MIETRRAGDSVVHARYYNEDEDPGAHDELMTVRQLAENQLGAVRESPHCEPALRHTLQSAID